VAQATSARAPHAPVVVHQDNSVRFSRSHKPFQVPTRSQAGQGTLPRFTFVETREFQSVRPHSPSTFMCGNTRRTETPGHVAVCCRKFRDIRYPQSESGLSCHFQTQSYAKVVVLHSRRTQQSYQLPRFNVQSIYHLRPAHPGHKTLFFDITECYRSRLAAGSHCHGFNSSIRPHCFGRLMRTPYICLADGQFAKWQWQEAMTKNQLLE